MADKNTTQFNKPPEDILNERQLTPEQQAAKDRMERMKRPRVPLGGAPPVRIPPLNAEPIEGGGTMEQQAEILRDPTSPLSPAYNPNLAMMAQAGERPLTPDQMARLAKGGMPGLRMDPDGGIRTGPADGGGGPFSVLPPSATKDPNFRPGIGAMYAGNQPGIRKAQQAASVPQSGDGYRPTLSEETKRSMDALATFQAQAEGKQVAEANKAKDEKTKTPVEPLGDETDMQRELREMLNNDYQWNLLNNPDRKKKIAARLKPMEITDIILHGEIHQDVPIDPEKLIVTYRSVTGEEDLAVKKMMGVESGPDRYLLDKFTLMQLSLAIVSINRQDLPTHLKDGKFDEAKFLVKLEKVLKFPIQFLADLGIQYLWFDERVRDLFVGSTEALKNG